VQENTFAKVKIREKRISENSESTISQNLERYGIYQINLIFKVLRGLKARCKPKGLF
jgi:hypothetical protein